MKKYAVLGAGLMGRVAAKDLLTVETDAEVILIDYDSSQLKNAQQFIHSDRLKTVQADVTDTKGVVPLLAGRDAVVGALPHRFILDGFAAVIEAKTPYVDLILDEPEKQFAFNDQAEKAGIVIIPGLGVAPGISNVCAGRGHELLDCTDDIIIYVGGIPKKKVPPLEYQTVYALETLFDTYTRQVRLFRNGEETSDEPLSELEIIKFDEPFGDLEAFNTNGLASLMMTMRGKVKNLMVEKTLRYPGHVEKIKILSELGLLSFDTVKIGNAEIAPVDMVIHQAAPVLKLGPEGDILVMRIIVKGEKDGTEKTHTFEVIDYYDPKEKLTAMGRTTTFPATTAARMISDGHIKQTGVKFSEEVFLGDLFERFMQELRDHNISVKHF